MVTAPFEERGSMCGKCDEIDAKITRYRRIASQFSDEKIQEGLATLLEKLQAEKALLHPDLDK
jgi:hypothetical protein